MGQRRTRVLVVTDSGTPSPALLHVVAQRAARDDVQFRLVVLNPAKAELHLLHPERHDRAFEAECILLATLPLLERAAGAKVIGSVSVRHDPAEAIEESVLSEPVEEIIVAMAGTGTKSWLHRDLPHRLGRFGVPVAMVT
jgi:hypothetical protein